MRRRSRPAAQTRRPPHIPQRRRIFLGCERQSELGYGTLLARIARERAIHVHLDVQVLKPGAGDPLALIERAAQIIENIERRRDPFAVKAVLLDIGSPQIVARARARARAAEVGIHHLIWQSPDHEAILLRHLPGCRDRRPPRGVSMGALLGEWAEYEKPMKIWLSADKGVPGRP
jgi:hypothetical protein